MEEEDMFRPEPLDLLLIAIAAMLLFGANRLPEVARSMGKAIREFRAGLTGEDEQNKPKSS
jgi:TatA/E family protein of Tat protein translocase